MPIPEEVLGGHFIIPLGKNHTKTHWPSLQPSAIIHHQITKNLFFHIIHCVHHPHHHLKITHHRHHQLATAPPSSTRTIPPWNRRNKSARKPVFLGTQIAPSRKHGFQHQQKRTTTTNKSVNETLQKPVSSSNLPGACVGSVGGVGGVRTVKKLRLSKALTIPEGTSVFDACRRMAHRRVDKDIAIRVIAEGLRPEQTILSKVMTRNPTYVTADSLAMDALQKMVQGKSGCICSSIISLEQLEQLFNIDNYYVNRNIQAPTCC